MSTTKGNEAQAEMWNGPVGERWSQYWRHIDAILEPLSRPLLARAGAQVGERVIDIGCAQGTTTLALAEQVSSSGAVLGVDLSSLTLAIARERAARATQVEFVAADATDYPFEEGSWDLAISRFGVMFFADPVRSFSQVGRALRPGGRLAFVCWQAVQDNEWIALVAQVAKEAGAPEPEETPDPDGPGAFSLADPTRIGAILSSAGFRGVTTESLQPKLRIGATPEEAARFMLEMGPVASMVEDAEPSLRAKVETALVERFREFASDEGVHLGAAAWLVSATSA